MDSKFSIDSSKILTVNAVIDWMRTAKDISSEDFSLMVLYSFLWDRLLNADRRCEGLPEEMVENIFLELKDILDETNPTRIDFSDYGPIMVAPLSPHQDIAYLYRRGLRLLMKLGRTEYFSSEIMKNRLTPILDQKLLDISNRFGGAPKDIVGFRTMTIPENSPVRFQWEDFVSVSLDAISSLLQFGVNSYEEGKKIVFMQVIICESCPVLPLFLSGFQASTEQEIVIVPGCVFEIVERREKMSDPVKFLNSMIKKTQANLVPYVKEVMEDLLSEARVDFFKVTVRRK